MTREEAIKSALKFLVRKQQEQGSWGYADNDDTHEVSWDKIIEWVDSCNTAIKALEQIGVIDTNDGDLISRQAVIDRINKLIEVEKKQGTDDWGYGRERVNAYEAMLHFVKSEYLYPSIEPKKCGDCISRQAIESALYNLGLGDEENGGVEYKCALADVKAELKNIPSVEPEQKTGKWINIDGSTNRTDCSCCGNRGRAWMKYCYMCGRRMEVDD